MIVESSVLSSISSVQHGFGTEEEPVPGFLKNSWESSRPKWKQVHGVALAEVQSSQQECGEVDALWTQQPGIPIAVATADCVPILLAEKTGKAVAAIHAGWRGVRARILRVFWEKLKNQGETPQDWVAAIGPAIGPCCYQVSEELAEDFSKEFSSFGKDLAVPRFRILDLPAIQKAELEDLGIGKVDLIRACTLCSTNPRWNSFRRDQGKARQYSVVRKLF